MVNNLIDKIEEAGVENVDLHLAEAYERRESDRVYFDRLFFSLQQGNSSSDVKNIKEKKPRKKREVNPVLQRKYDLLRKIADSDGVDVDNPMNYTETKIYHLVQIMRYTSLNGPDGEKISIYGAKPERIGLVYKDCYDRGKPN